MKKLPIFKVIYAIMNDVNNKIYIGSAVNFRMRVTLHKSQLKNNKHHCIHLQRAYNKHGQDIFSYHILEYVDDVNELIKTEQKWIDFFKPEYNINKVAGNRLGMVHTEESKSKMSNSHKGLNNWTLGTKASSETKKLMSEQRKGGLNGRAKKVIIDEIIYDSLTEAGETLGINRNTIRHYINTKDNYNYYE